MELKVDDLIAVAKVVRAAGITSIKLTGGDPALYGPLEDAVLRLRREAGFDEVEVISRRHSGFVSSANARSPSSTSPQARGRLVWSR